MFLRSERLFLRPFWPEDRAELVALSQTGAARVPGWPISAMVAVPDEPEDRRCPQFLITAPGADGARIVGFVGLVRRCEIAELVIWIAPQWRGRGFAAESVKAILLLARTLGHDRVSATIFPGNREAIRLFERLGFIRTGQVRAQVCPVAEQLLPSATFVAELGGAFAGKDGSDGNCPASMAA